MSNLKKKIVRIAAQNARTNPEVADQLLEAVGLPPRFASQGRTAGSGDQKAMANMCAKAIQAVTGERARAKVGKWGTVSCKGGGLDIEIMDNGDNEFETHIYDRTGGQFDALLKASGLVHMGGSEYVVDYPSTFSDVRMALGKMTMNARRMRMASDHTAGGDVEALAHKCAKAIRAITGSRARTKISKWGGFSCKGRGLEVEVMENGVNDFEMHVYDRSVGEYGPLLERAGLTNNGGFEYILDGYPATFSDASKVFDNMTRLAGRM